MLQQLLTEQDGSTLVVVGGSTRYVSVTLNVNSSAGGVNGNIPITPTVSTIDGEIRLKTGPSRVVDVIHFGAGTYQIRLSPEATTAIAKALTIGTEAQVSLILSAHITTQIEGSMYKSGDVLVFDFVFRIRRVQ